MKLNPALQGKQFKTRSEVPGSKSLTDKFLLSYEQYSRSGENWQAWFGADYDPNEDEITVESPEIMPDVFVDQMISSGEVLWSHPGWVKLLSDVLWDWLMAGKLVKAQMITQWLKGTVPDFLRQGELFDDICAIAEGEWHELHPSSSSHWPKRDVEYYARTSQLRMAAIAKDCRDRYVVGAKMIACGVTTEYPDCESRPELF